MINNYELGLASKNDYEGIVEFIQAEYKKNHIITRDEILFRREYEDDKNLNFICETILPLIKFLLVGLHLWWCLCLVEK